MLELTTITKSFGADHALHEISGEFFSDDVVLVTGANGAGKSTLLKCIAGIYEVDSGKRTTRANSCTYLSPTSLGLYEHLTVRQNLDFFASIQQSKASADVAAYWGLFKYIDKKISALSLGQKMRVALARVFLQHHDIIVLDEPTVGLDDEGLQLLKQQLSNTKSLLVIATHDPELFKPLSTYQLVLHHGKILDAIRTESSYASTSASNLGTNSSLLSLLRKDFLLELSARETLISLGNFSVLLYTLIAVGLANAIIADSAVQRIYPVLFWVFFFLIGLLSADRGHAYETKMGAHQAVLLSNIPTRTIYISKWITMVTTLLIAGGIQALLGYLFLGSSLSAPLALLALSSLGVAAVAVLLSAISSTSKLPSLTLPLLALPALTPLFLGLQELSYDFGASPWASIVIGLDVLYFTLGINLYEFATKE